MADEEATASPTVYRLENLDGKDLVAGYPMLAGEMGFVPESAMFRSFSTLGVQVVLYMQSEIVALENELRAVEHADKDADSYIRKNYCKDWNISLQLRQSITSPSVEDNKQSELVMSIKEKLVEYYDFIERLKRITGLPDPNSFDLENIQNLLGSKRMPLTLIGADKDIWGNHESKQDRQAYSADLVALHARHNEDLFSKWFTNKGMNLFFRLRGDRFRKPVRGVTSYRDQKLLRITMWITSVFASMLPIASIFVLYYQRSMRGRLATITSFNLVLSVCLTTLTNARRSEVFAVTSAFAAVQVVFVATNSTFDSRITA